mmetsp:Transcript_29140/g.21678  ORF Transcript_29140/g.21678 Transcript_29140/m.21678 type:complete len:109 (-) Transcript_29140:373-699(-)
MPNCPGYYLKSSKKLKVWCSQCHTPLCGMCGEQFHAKSCKELYQKKLKAWTKGQDNVSSCPKCDTVVEKVSGCNHMTCYFCGYQWCWLCGSTYTSGHFSKLNAFGCPG